jgi:hypothetical protein
VRCHAHHQPFRCTLVHPKPNTATQASTCIHAHSATISMPTTHNPHRRLQTQPHPTRHSPHNMAWQGPATKPSPSAAGCHPPALHSSLLVMLRQQCTQLNQNPCRRHLVIPQWASAALLLHAKLLCNCCSAAKAPTDYFNTTHTQHNTANLLVPPAYNAAVHS